MTQRDVETTRAIDHEVWEVPGRRSTLEMTSEYVGFIVPMIFGIGVTVATYLAGLPIFVGILLFVFYGLLGLALWTTSTSWTGTAGTRDETLRLEREGITVRGQLIVWKDLRVRARDGALVFSGNSVFEIVETGLSQERLVELVGLLEAQARSVELEPVDEASVQALERLLRHTKAA